MDDPEFIQDYLYDPEENTPTKWCLANVFYDEFSWMLSCFRGYIVQSRFRTNIGFEVCAIAAVVSREDVEEFLYMQYEHEHDGYQLPTRPNEQLRRIENINGRISVYPQLVYYYYNETGMCVAILKTVWIRLIQRTWRRVLAERRVWEAQYKKMRIQPTYEVRAPLPGRPKYPSLRGMICSV